MIFMWAFGVPWVYREFCQWVISDLKWIIRVFRGLANEV